MRRSGTLSYLHGDHLGSTALTTSDTGTLVSRFAYLPFGGVRYVTGTVQSDKRFTGQRLDGTGLYDYGARWHDAAVGRFTQADTIVLNPGRPPAPACGGWGAS